MNYASWRRRRRRRRGRGSRGSSSTRAAWSSFRSTCMKHNRYEVAIANTPFKYRFPHSAEHELTPTLRTFVIAWALNTRGRPFNAPFMYGKSLQIFWINNNTGRSAAVWVFYLENAIIFYSLFVDLEWQNVNAMHSEWVATTASLLCRQYRWIRCDIIIIYFFLSFQTPVVPIKWNNNARVIIWTETNLNKTAHNCLVVGIRHSIFILFFPHFVRQN